MPKENKNKFSKMW